MPGGSVNGRPFRESSDSFSRTGIPCGNPRRFHSHEVVRMETGVRSVPRPIDGPVEDIETAGEMHLQKLLQKQMDTKITLQQQMKQKKVFAKSTEYQPVTDGLSGMVTLDDFKSLGKTDNYIEEMRGYGLTNEEILYKLQSEETDESVPSKKSRLSNQDHHEARLKEIEHTIQQKKSTLAKPDNFSDVKKLSRHEMELERTLSKASDRNKFLHKVLITEKETDTSLLNKDDPMNALPEILATVTEYKHQRRRHRRRNYKADGYKSSCNLECCVPQASGFSTCMECAENLKSCDETDTTGPLKNCGHTFILPTCIEKPVDYVSIENTESDITKTLKSDKNAGPNQKEIPTKSTEFTVKTRKSVVKDNGLNEISKKTEQKPGLKAAETPGNGEMREIENIDRVPEEAIKGYKLSAEEVRKLPRFEAYSPGEPSNVLYLKNLSPKVTEQDLAAMFIQYQENDDNRIVFKLLTGRMKGQAFVTFTDVVTATKALDLVHGYEFKGKPIIIQYGRKSSN